MLPGGEIFTPPETKHSKKGDTCPMTTLQPQPANEANRSALDAADIASAQRVLALHRQYPDKTADELVDLVIRNSCIQMASQSAANAGLAVLPAISIIGALAVGALANQINTIHQRQAELVLDIATIYRYPFRPNEKPFYLAVALGLPLDNQPNQRPSSNQRISLPKAASSWPSRPRNA
jgi:hypothetical protein